MTTRPAADDRALKSLVASALAGPVAALGGLSIVSNLLMLTGPLFMMQVYDRVLSSYSVPTLVALTIIVAILFAFFGVIDALRSRIVLRIGDVIDERLRLRLFRAGVRSRVGGMSGAEPTADADALRQFSSSAGVLSFLDLPWMPIYVAIVFGLHVGLGWLALGGVAVVSGFLIINEVLARRPGAEAQIAEVARRQRLDDAQSNAESAVAMGMLHSLERRWGAATSALRAAQATSTDRSSSVSSASKAVRFFLQSAVLALGAYYVIQAEMTAGSIIAASVITARALAPVEQVIAHWKGFLGARKALGRIAAVYRLPDVIVPATELPPPTASLQLIDVSILSPDKTAVLVRGISVELQAGDALGVIGPSGSGKTTLARGIVGAWRSAGGTIRLDGAELDQYDPDRFGNFIGYLPQRVELFDGTVAENISRFAENPSSDDVIAAGRTAGAHTLILNLSDGYDTYLGPQGALLSAGQRQRIGLARAVFRRPFLVVLDEPNSNLDAEGDEALTAAIRELREGGSIVVVIAHRPSAIAATTHILTLNAGQQVAFGPRADVLAQLNLQVR